MSQRASPGIAGPSPLPHDQMGLPGGPMLKSKRRLITRIASRKTIEAHAARTIHFDAIPMPRMMPSRNKVTMDPVGVRLWVWARYSVYARRMKKIGKMSIIPMRDWRKNMPSKQTSVAAAVANRRYGQRRRARRDIKGTHREPMMQTAIRHPNVLKPRSM